MRRGASSPFFPNLINLNLSSNDNNDRKESRSPLNRVNLANFLRECPKLEILDLSNNRMIMSQDFVDAF